jgi:hypothetical protein
MLEGDHQSDEQSQFNTPGEQVRNADLHSSRIKQGQSA